MYGFYVVATGLVIVAIVYVAALINEKSAADVSTVVGSVTGVIGTLVGVYFGNSVGASGKEKAETARNTAEARLQTMAVRAAKGNIPQDEIMGILKS